MSGHSGLGLLINGGVDNVVAGNIIGMDAAGANPVPNAGPGVWIVPSDFGGVHVAAEGNRIERNNISANRGDGVLISGTTAETGVLVGTRNNTLSGNTISGNAGNGVLLTSGAAANRIGTSATSMTGDAGNVIASNGLDGVRVVGDNTVRNSIRGNSIYSNGHLGIDLGGDGVTPNDDDAVDSDAGPNELQNYPRLAAARADAGGTHVRGTLHSKPMTTYTVDFYASATADPSGFGEGQRWLGAIAITTNLAGSGRIDHLLPALVSRGEFVTATATENVIQNTSEFSKAQPVVGLPARSNPMGTPVPPTGAARESLRNSHADIWSVGAWDSSPVDRNTVGMVSPLGPLVDISCLSGGAGKQANAALPYVNGGGSDSPIDAPWTSSNRLDGSSVNEPTTHNAQATAADLRR